MKDADTEYGIGWLPLGGYCKINGMIDESLDTSMLGSEPKPWEFRSKPAWQRALVMAGGVLFNFLFAICVYIFMLAHWGSDYLSNEQNKIYVNELAYEMGFRNGDRILKFDDYEPKDFSMLQADLARRSVRTATVLRGEDTVVLYMDKRMVGEMLNSPGMFTPAIPFAIDSLASGSVNAGSGLRHGDVVIGIDTVAVAYVQDAWKLLAGKAGGQITAKVLRGADTLAVPLQVDSAGRIGVMLQVPGMQKREYTLAQAIPAGVEYTWNMVSGYVRDLKLVATPSTGGVQVCRQLHRDRAGVPVALELADIHQLACYAVDNARCYEPYSDTGIGRRPPAVPDSGDGHRPQTEREVYDGSPDIGHVPVDGDNGFRLRQ